jgi:SnoaL-like domain
MSQQRTTQVLQRFNQAFLSHDPTLIEELLTSDCVLESVDGSRYTGYDACLEFWSKMAADERFKYEPEDIWIAGERGVIHWRWGTSEEDSVRGVHLMRLRAGQIFECLSYQKGP